jgi:hypothetical protein
MAREIPEVVRAAAGLAATVLDEARKLPETLPGLPVRVIGLAMQSALKLQQQYAGFVARGDELFTGLRGEDEPGLATFDDELDDTDAAPASNGYRESAFDRAEVPLTEVSLTEDHGEAPAAEKAARKKAARAARPAKAAKPARKPRKAAATDAAEQVEGAQATLEALPDEAPSTEEVLEELAIDEMVGDAPVTAADADTDVTADVSTTADVLTPDGGVATVEASVTDEGVAAPETPPADDTAVDEGGTPVAAAPPAAASAPTTAATAPIDGYDDFSIAQLRGRLRGYALSTVADLVAYEEANRAREPYLRMLRNRLEKVQEQAVEASPLAPRGA